MQHSSSRTWVFSSNNRQHPLLPHLHRTVGSAAAAQPQPENSARNAEARNRNRRPLVDGPASAVQQQPASSALNAAVPSLPMTAAGPAPAALPIPANFARTAAARNLPEFPSTAATSVVGSRKILQRLPVSAPNAVTPLITAISYKEVMDNGFI